jgi:hypothetical protein
MVKSHDILNVYCNQVDYSLVMTIGEMVRSDGSNLKHYSNHGMQTYEELRKGYRDWDAYVMFRIFET